MRVTPTARTCPDCTSAMARGVIAGRSPGVKFKPRGDLLGDLTGALLTHGFFNHSAEAFRCPQCGLVIVPGRD